MNALPILPDKALVAASFSRAAGSYDAVAALQRRVGLQLMEVLPTDLSPRRWLDLGCGTGHFSRQLAACYPQGEGLALDIAEGMLRHARPLGGARHFLAGDAEAVPLREASCELIYSSLALQWCANLPAVLDEARRVLRAGGVLAFSSLVDGTLDELRQSWRQVDERVHVNRFRQLADYQALCVGSGLRLLHLERRPLVLHFPDLLSLMRELKALGAQNLNPGRPLGLTGRAQLRALAAAYEQFRQPPGLPATYQVVYAVLEKG